MRFRELPARVVTGTYIFHSGLDKWRGDEATAEAVHGMAAGARGSVWPTQQGIAISKDVWMLGIGVGLLADTWSTRHNRARRTE